MRRNTGLSPGRPVAAIGHDPAALEAFYREHLDAVRGRISGQALLDEESTARIVDRIDAERAARGLPRRPSS